MNATLGVIVHETIKYDYKVTTIVAIVSLLMIFNQARTIIKIKKQTNEVLQMDELKRQTSKHITELTNFFEEILRKGEENGEIDTFGLSSKIAEVHEKLDNAFIEAKLRLSNKKNGGFFRR